MHPPLPPDPACVGAVSLACRSKLPRVSPASTTAAPDIVYDTDTMQKMSLVTKVETSPILYANMSRSKVQRAGMVSLGANPAEIGPGAYNCPIRSDVRTSLVLNQNPLSRCDAQLCRAEPLSSSKLCMDPFQFTIRWLYSYLCLAVCCHGQLGLQPTRWILQRTLGAHGSKRGTPSTGAEAKQFARHIRGCSRFKLLCNLHHWLGLLTTSSILESHCTAERYGPDNCTSINNAAMNVHC